VFFLKYIFVILILLLIIILFSCDLFSLLNQSEYNDKGIGRIVYKGFYNYDGYNGIVISPCGKHIYMSNNIGGLDVYERNIKTGELKYINNYSNITQFCMSSNGKYIYAYYSSSDIQIYERNINSGILTYIGKNNELNAFTLIVSYLIISNDGKNLYVSDTNNDYIHIFQLDINSGTIKYTNSFTSGFTDPLRITFSPDGRYLFLNSDSASLNLFQRDINSGNLKFLWNNGDAQFGIGVTVSRDGKYIYHCENYGTFIVYEMDLNNGNVSYKQNFTTYSAGNAETAVSNDNRIIYRTTHDNNYLICYERKNDGTLKVFDSIDVGGDTDQIIVSPDDRFIYVVSWNIGILYWFERRWD
jgi:6-phosphogluconolactonase (cycloisomerase 2 family)